MPFFVNNTKNKSFIVDVYYGNLQVFFENVIVKQNVK